jgi:hypothetical protein
LAGGDQLEVERARILDMYLLYPALLHKTSMPQTVRATFSALGIRKPNQIFISLPSTASIFQDLRLYQNAAFTHLRARRLIATESLRQGLLQLEADSVPASLIQGAQQRNDEDGGLTAFLTGTFSTIPLRGSDNIYKRAHLPSRAIAV